MPGIERLDLSVAGRIEHNADLPVGVLLRQERVPVRVLWAPDFEG